LTVFRVVIYIAPFRTANPGMGKIFVHGDNGDFNSETTRVFFLKQGIYSMLACP